MSDDTFGFSGAKKTSVADKIKTIVPQSDPRAEIALERVDRIAESAGFTSREPVPTAPPLVSSQKPTSTYITRRKKETGPTVAINMRVPIHIAEPFQRFCDENRYTYWQGIEELLRRADLIRV